MEDEKATNKVVSMFNRAVPSDTAKLTFTAGSVVVRENEAAGCAYLIDRGTVRVSRQHDGADIELAELGPGDLFGEIALVDRRVRTATVTATSDLEVMPISRDQLARLLSESDPLVKLMLRVSTDRLRYSMTKNFAQASGEDAGEATSTASSSLYETTRMHAIDELRLEGRIREALVKGEFTVYYQPIISIRKRKLAGFEALVRWLDPNEGLLGPGAFIDVAERTGLIVQLGAQVLEKACKFAKEFNEQVAARHKNAPPIFMGINLSALQLADLDSALDIIEIMRGTEVDPATIKLEVTENLFINKPDVAEACLRRLKEFGVAIAIDDFGTGYSSLSYLRRFPLDTLKIDRSFVVDSDQEGSRAIMQTVCDLAEALGMDVVAEGVESSKQFTTVAELGCTYVQGFLLSPSMPEADAMAMADGSMPKPKNVKPADKKATADGAQDEGESGGPAEKAADGDATSGTTGKATASGANGSGDTGAGAGPDGTSGGAG